MGSRHSCLAPRWKMIPVAMPKSAGNLRPDVCVERQGSLIVGGVLAALPAGPT